MTFLRIKNQFTNIWRIHLNKILINLSPSNISENIFFWINKTTIPRSFLGTTCLKLFNIYNLSSFSLKRASYLMKGQYWYLLKKNSKENFSKMRNRIKHTMNNISQNIESSLFFKCAGKYFLFKNILSLSKINQQKEETTVCLIRSYKLKMKTN